MEKTVKTDTKQHFEK